MMSWTPARDREKYGVAIYNFSGINEACIKLNVGNTVQILEELGGWFFGYTLDNKALRGVFPKSYIQVRDCIVDKSGPVEVVTARLPPIVQEVTAVLREWGVLLRKLYVERSKEFTLLRDTMTELIVHRSKILCGQLPGDELKQLKHRITLGIDRVNAKLGLDLVVRDENGNILNPDITSAVKLFRHHDEAAAQLRKHESSHGRAPSVRRKSHLAWTALVAIKNIIIKVPEPSEISLGLYIGDPREGREKPLTEAFIIPWTDEGYNSHPDLLLKLKCLFTDLSTATLDDNQVWLIGSVVRLGSMASKEVDPRRVSSMMGKKSIYTNDSMRRPFGVLMMDITPLITKQRSITVPANGTQDEDHFATFYPCGEKETLDMKKLLSRDVVRDNKTGFQGIWFTFQLINGDIKQLQEDNPHYVALRDVPVALRLGLSDVIMPGDVRNDLYVTLLSGEFSRGAKTCDRNVEVTVRICNERGEVIPIDGKKWNDGDSNYLSLPWRRINGEEIVKSWNHGVAPSLKDSFTISTTFCSTKLTQNAELLRLLEWGWSGSQDKQTLLSCLQGLRRVPPEELMVFLQDTLDVLLEILMNNTTDDESDNYVFEALIYVITIATDKNKHEAFQPVLDSYIQQNFHATLAYNKLIHVLKDYVREGQNTKRQETLKKAMKCLQYVFKFITRSRQLFVELYGRGQEEFEKSLQQLLEEMALMMKHTVDTTLTVQAHCLNEILVKMIDNLEPRRIPKQKLMTMNEIIHSELFKIPDCRRVLLPSFIVIIRSLLDANEEAADYEVVMRKERNIEKLKRMLDFDSLAHLPEARNMTEELELCVKILGDILDVLFSSDVGPTIEDISLLSFKMLEAILSTICRMTRDDPLICKFVSALVSLLRQMTERHYKNFLNKFQTSDQLCIFLLDLLLVVENLVKVPVFPSDWAEMILLQNSVIVTVLKQCSRVICERLLDPFKEPVWCKFFHCAISFITQHKIRFVAATDGRQSMVGPFLKMTMLPDVELRKGTIPIFFDMMQCEFYSSRDQGKDLPPDMARNNQKNKGKFNEFENEMLEKLDQLVESGHGDEHYRQVFQNIIGALYEDHATMREPGRKFVSTVTRLMDRLLQYRTIMNTPDNSAETRMSCIELYLRYVYKLSELHLACDNYTEAGYTLRQHADLLRWSSDPLSVALRSPHYLNIDRHDELKEKLYEEIISYFDKGKVFVYRGNGFERLADFTSRILDQFPNAELMKKLTPPSDEVKESPQQFLQISKVDCAVQGQKLLSTAVAEQIRSYYRANHVKVFTYSRPFHRILRCFPVIKTRSIELSPLENAVETMSTANTEVYDLVKKYSRDSTLLLHPLTRKVSGMVDAAVMGGIVNYEKAFLTPEYIASHPNDEEKLDNLRHLIAAQIPILEAALSIHANRVTEPVAGLHEHMVTSFSKMKAQVQDKYGEAEMPEDLKIQIRPLRLQSQLSVNSDQASRSSHLYSNHDSVEADGMELGSPREESRNDKPRMSFTRGLHAISSELIFM
ncbi:Dedicator of cytokinesis protein 2-like [Homarus americanus]|uniref:Dedicator of cytokinesis protein 2-like n=1 Tax=Homarus americanus TaxID=6706 RepID=A0A8J5MQG8_HOMAM|nr:Dedicator of cytokinesis protein 2-like [Homarus americanus]